MGGVVGGWVENHSMISSEQGQKTAGEDREREREQQQ